MPKTARQRQCGNKIRHKNRTGAIIHLKKLGNAQMRFYLCPFCHGYHIGHSRTMEAVQARFDQLLGPALMTPRQTRRNRAG